MPITKCTKLSRGAELCGKRANRLAVEVQADSYDEQLLRRTVIAILSNCPFRWPKSNRVSSLQVAGTNLAKGGRSAATRRGTAATQPRPTSDHFAGTRRVRSWPQFRIKRILSGCGASFAICGSSTIRNRSPSGEMS